jgi:hypothetical protein
MCKRVGYFVIAYSIAVALGRAGDIISPVFSMRLKRTLRREF